MDAEKLYATWAPPDSAWAPWVKPVLFTAFDDPQAPGSPGGDLEGGPPATPSAHFDAQAAYVVDLPGALSVDVGLALARVGYRPVPLYNTAHHPFAAVPVAGILARLSTGAAELAALGLPPAAPPAFLLDSRRLAPPAPPAPGSFDNRWITFPQDFPSAPLLSSRGIRRVILVQEDRAVARRPPGDDLAHVLLRFREGGIELFSAAPDLAAAPQPLAVERPSRFRGLLYRTLALTGLRRNSAGGFGSIIPLAASGSGFG